MFHLTIKKFPFNVFSRFSCKNSHTLSWAEWLLCLISESHIFVFSTPGLCVCVLLWHLWVWDSCLTVLLVLTFICVCSFPKHTWWIPRLWANSFLSLSPSLCSWLALSLSLSLLFSFPHTCTHTHTLSFHLCLSSVSVLGCWFVLRTQSCIEQMVTVFSFPDLH